jgi:adenylate cyclase
MGDISNEADSDGISRRVSAFKDYYVWDPLFKNWARKNGLKLLLDPHQITFLEPVTRQTNLTLEVDSNGFFQVEDLTRKNHSAGFVHLAHAYAKIRVWHMGVMLAARELNLDLSKALVELDRRRIRLLDADGAEKRVIPVDDQGRFLVDWSLTTTDPRFTKSNLEHLLYQDLERMAGQTENLTNRWKNKLVVVGSAATGSNLTDLGATPLESKTFSAGTIWNAANSVISGRFIRQSSYQIELVLILCLGFASAVSTWKLAPPWPSVCVILLSIGYFLLSAFVYEKWRYWMPLVLPVGGGLIMTHISSVSCQALMERRERQRIKDIFTRIVSPDVVNELLNAETLSIDGVQRHVTVLFADVRGFTEIIDLNKARIEEHIQLYRLTGRSAEAYSDEAARETLATVNLYLATVADIVKLHQGTLDKYIGDCVMAFWGAPMLNPEHALACVRAAIDAQRAIQALNDKRFLENTRREAENQRLLARGQQPLPMLSLLSLGTGINTGRVMVGLMGSDEHLLNYTLFGREVNLASRLEGISGRSRILIGEATFGEIERDDPKLASICIAQPAVLVKGMREPVRSYEVPWKYNHSTTVLEPSSGSFDESAPDNPLT